MLKTSIYETLVDETRDLASAEIDQVSGGDGPIVTVVYPGGDMTAIFSGSGGGADFGGYINSGWGGDASQDR